MIRARRQADIEPANVEPADIEPANADAVSSAALDALGDPTRRAIVEMLATAPASVQSIADRLPISRPAVSRHLRLLKEAALVADDPVGTQRVYRLRAEGVEAIRAYFQVLWGDATTRYRIAVENLDQKPPGRTRRR